MDPTTLLLLLTPVVAFALVFGVVMVVALCRARPEDVPTMTSAFVHACVRLVGRLPRIQRSLQEDDGLKPTMGTIADAGSREDER